MNVTEEKMVKAFKEGRNVRNGPTKIWDYGWQEMGCNRDEIRDGRYLLWGTVIAEKKDGILILGIKGDGWRSKTTKSRINAVAQEFGKPCIWQDRGAWTWGDGVLYDGAREFKI